MTQEERLEIRQVIEDVVKPISVKLESIDNHLSRQNGKVDRHEKIIAEALEWRGRKYQQIDDKFTDYDECMADVKVLTKDNITNKAMKTYNRNLFIISTTIITIVIALVGLILHFNIQG